MQNTNVPDGSTGFDGLDLTQLIPPRPEIRTHERGVQNSHPDQHNLTEDLSLSAEALAEKYAYKILKFAARASKRTNRGVNLSEGDFTGALSIAMLKAIAKWDRTRPLGVWIDNCLRCAGKEATALWTGAHRAQHTQRRADRGAKSHGGAVRIIAPFYIDASTKSFVDSAKCPSPSPLAQLEERETLTHLRSALAGLSSMEREVITRMFFLEQSREQIAEEVGRTVWYVRQEADKALKKLSRHQALRATAGGAA
jgi:RNA polymerase sigma factor (sigma-70 family)